MKKVIEKTNLNELSYYVGQEDRENMEHVGFILRIILTHECSYMGVLR